MAFVSLIAFYAMNSGDNDFPSMSSFTWWAVMYSLVLNVIVFCVVASDTVHTYHVAVTGYSAVGVALVSFSLQFNIFRSNAAQQAVATGLVLLAIIQVSFLTGSYIRDSSTNFEHRWSGFSISDQRLLLPPALSWTPSP